MDLAQRRHAQQQHAQPIHAEGKPRVRRRAKAESVQQKSEAFARFLLVKAQGAKHLLLDIRAVDAHAAAAQLHAVENHIIGLRPHLWFGLVILHQLHILQKRHGEGVVHGGIALFVLFVFKHGKIRHQRELEIARVGQSQQVRAFQAQAAQHAPAPPPARRRRRG